MTKKGTLSRQPYQNTHHLAFGIKATAVSLVQYTLILVTKAFDGTWHDTQVQANITVPHTITVQFNGTAVYAYSIIPNSFNSTEITTNMTFTLDGNYVNSYLYVGDQSTDLIYNVPVYANLSLSNEEHTLVIEATPGPFAASTVLFDYVEYTVDDDGSSHSEIGTIVGGILGGLGGLVLVGCAIFFIRRRRRRGHVKKDLTAYPTYIAQSTQPSTDISILTGKAAPRQAELNRLERAMGDLQRHQNHSLIPSTSRTSHLPTSSSAMTGHAESELATQIAELRMDVADLRNRPSGGDVPPPRYSRAD